MYLKQFKKKILLTLIISSVLLSSVKASDECFEGISRSIFKFNMVLDSVVIEPVAKGFNKLPRANLKTY